MAGVQVITWAAARRTAHGMDPVRRVGPCARHRASRAAAGLAAAVLRRLQDGRYAVLTCAGRLKRALRRRLAEEGLRRSPGRDGGRARRAGHLLTWAAARRTAHGMDPVLHFARNFMAHPRSGRASSRCGPSQAKATAGPASAGPGRA